MPFHEQYVYHYLHCMVNCYLKRLAVLFQINERLTDYTVVRHQQLCQQKTCKFQVMQQLKIWQSV